MQHNNMRKLAQYLLCADQKDMPCGRAALSSLGIASHLPGCQKEALSQLLCCPGEAGSTLATSLLHVSLQPGNLGTHSRSQLAEAQAVVSSCLRVQTVIAHHQVAFADQGRTGCLHTTPGLLYNAVLSMLRHVQGQARGQPAECRDKL